MSTPSEGLQGLLAGLEERIAALPRVQGEHAHGGAPGETTTVRTAQHGGHEIQIETTYRITVDGEPLGGHIDVADDGSVHYHGLPQYAPASAIELVKLIIDYLGTEPPADDELGRLTGHDGHPAQHR